MRILFITRKLSVHADGVGDYTRRLAAALGALGHVVAIQPVSQLLAACRRDEADVVALQFSPFMYGRRGVCLHLVGWLAMARWLGGARVLVTFHELYNQWGYGVLHAGLSLMHRLQFFLVGALAHEVVFTTARRAGLGRRWFFWKRERVRCVPVGSNIPRAGHNGDRRDGGVPLIATFGLLQTGVCYEELLRAFAGLVHEDGVAARLLLIGDWTAADPRRKQQLDELVRALRLEDRVEWSGPRPAAGVSALLSVSDLYVLYRADGPTTRSGTLAAALAHGLPVLANRVPDLDPAFAGGDAVRLFDDAADLRRQCRKLLQDPAQRAAWARRGREFYQATLTWERIAQQYTDIGAGAAGPVVAVATAAEQAGAHG